jgi:hypothetical protein
MASKPSTKLLAFYIGTIAAVVGLFAVVTAYGEQNLVAPPSLAGRYRFKTKLPCLGDRELTLQQSGAFLTATFPGRGQNAQLTGQLQPDSRLDLKANQLPCDRRNPLENVTIQGRRINGNQPNAVRLSGVLTYGASNPQNVPFEAIQVR